MAKTITMKAQLRSETGKNAMRRLRAGGMLPGIVFGRSGETVQVSFETGELERVLHSESGFNTIFSIDVEEQQQDGPTRVIIKHYQLDPVTHDFLHVSFYRIHMDRLIEVGIPVIAEGVAPGVKDQGGTLDFVMREVQIECLPGDIPEGITVDIEGMEIGDYVRVGELSVPADVKILEEIEAVVIHLAPPRKIEEVVAEEVEGEEAEVAEGEEGEPAEEPAEGEPEE